MQTDVKILRDRQHIVDFSLFTGFVANSKNSKITSPLFFETDVPNLLSPESLLSNRFPSLISGAVCSSENLKNPSSDGAKLLPLHQYECYTLLTAAISCYCGSEERDDRSSS